MYSGTQSSKNTVTRNEFDRKLGLTDQEYLSGGINFFDTSLAHIKMNNDIEYFKENIMERFSWAQPKDINVQIRSPHFKELSDQFPGQEDSFKDITFIHDSDYDKYDKLINDLEKEIHDPGYPGVAREKERIIKQKESSEYHREDHFAIGTVYLNIPPTQISISEERNNIRINTLRSSGETTISTGKATTRIDLDIYFNGLDDVNNKLRPLLAQFKSIPFLPIENKYISSVVNPSGELIETAERQEAVKKQKEHLEFVDEKIKKIQELMGRETILKNKIVEQIENISKDGLIPDRDLYADLISYAHDISLVPKEDLNNKEYSNAQGVFSFSMYLRKRINIGVFGGSEKPSMLKSERNITQIGVVEEELFKLREHFNKLHMDAKTAMFKDKQIVGVLSQFAISTLPGYPETIACRISMYVFNYAPFAEDYGFTSGYEYGKWTTDITKCDLFIDWYARRFLSSGEEYKDRSLEIYSTDQHTRINMFEIIDPGNTRIVDSDTINVRSVDLNNDIIITGMSVSLRNIIKFLPILSHKNPTCQYMGSLNSDIQINMRITDVDKLKEVLELIERSGEVARINNRLTRYNYISIDNSFLKFCGMKFFVVNNFNVTTVKENPGVSDMSLSLSEYKFDTESGQKLRREGAVKLGDIEKTALFLLEKAHEFMLYEKGKSTHPNAHVLKKYGSYHYLLTNENNGWLEAGGGALVAFNEGWGAGSSTFKVASVAQQGNWRYLWNKLVSKVLIQNKEDTVGPVSVWAEGYTAPIKIDPEDNKMEYLRGPGRIEVLKDGIINFSSYFVDALNCEEEERRFSNNKDLVSKIIALVYRASIIRMINDQRKHPELRKLLLKGLSLEQKESVSDTCYPDLSLPAYIDLPVDNCRKFMNTYEESGMPKDKGLSPQLAKMIVDPDFFMHKIYFWKNGDEDADLYNYKLRGIEGYKKIALSNKKARWQKNNSLDEEGMQKHIESVTKSNSRSQEGPGIKSASVEHLYGTIVRVYDGDTFYAMVNGKETSIRVLGYNAPELKEFKDEEKRIRNRGWHPVLGKTAKAKLTEFLLPKGETGKEVKLYLGSHTYDKYDRLLAYPYVKINNKWVSVSAEMRKMKKELGLRDDSDIFDNSTVTKYREKLLYEQNESFVRVSSEQGKQNVVKNKSDDGETMSGSITSAVPVEKEDPIEKSWNQDPGWYSRESLTKFIANVSDGIASKFSDKNKDLEYGLDLFDRSADEHIELITEKIREGQKDDMFRMSRAFPAFKIYFLEEDAPEWGRFDDLYSYNAVQSIDIIKSRKEAADTAIIKLVNTKGVLDTSRFGRHDVDGNYIEKSEEKTDPAVQETDQEQVLENFILKAGTRVKIKMGYSSDPNLLDTAFSGMVAEVSHGDIVTIVVQGYGVELLNEIYEAGHKVNERAAFQFLDDLITRPDVLHFGKWELLPAMDDRAKVSHARMGYDDMSDEFEFPGWWRNIWGINHILSLKSEPRRMNIYHPTQSWWYNFRHGDTQAFTTTHKTIWDVFQEMTRRMPGYIATVLPYDERATIYFGPADFMYFYTDKNFTEELEADFSKTRDIAETSFEDKLRELSNVKSGRVERLKKAKVISYLGFLTRFISQNKDKLKYKDLITEMRLFIGSPIAVKGDERDIIKKIDTMVLHDVQASLGNSTEADQVKYGISIFKELVENNYNVIDVQKNYDGGIWPNITEDNESMPDFYAIPGGEPMSKAGVNKRYKRARNKLWLDTRSVRKPVRSYHYKDTIHHIIANNITASELNMNNMVTIEYGKNTKHKKRERNESYEMPKISIKADDSIYSNKIKNKVIRERNARDGITAWHYGLGNLWLEMRNMYTGHLTMLGDPSIKPYDIVFLNDYFNDMHGPIEVEQVVHHFSQETGFITTVVPDLLCYINNSMQLGANFSATAFYDSYSERIARVRDSLSPFGISVLGDVYEKFALKLTDDVNGFWSAAGLIIGMNGLRKARREPINFTPLMHIGRPYIAGIEGFRKDSFAHYIRGKAKKLVEYIQVTGPEHASAFLQEAARKVTIRR